VAVNPAGVVTGFGFGSASTTDQQVAETLFAVRCRPGRRLASVGRASQGTYIADKGFEGTSTNIGGGSIAMERSLSIRPNATVADPGPSA
jgi:hypothetical protein